MNNLKHDLKKKNWIKKIFFDKFIYEKIFIKNLIEIHI